MLPFPVPFPIPRRTESHSPRPPQPFADDQTQPAATDAAEVLGYGAPCRASTAIGDGAGGIDRTRAGLFGRLRGRQTAVGAGGRDSIGSAGVAPMTYPITSARVARPSVQIVQTDVVRAPPRVRTGRRGDQALGGAARARPSGSAPPAPWIERRVSSAGSDKRRSVNCAGPAFTGIRAANRLYGWLAFACRIAESGSLRTSWRGRYTRCRPDQAPGVVGWAESSRFGRR